MTASGDLRAALATLGRRWLGIRQLNHLTRFEPVLAELEQVRVGAGERTILDVGGGSSGITTLLSADWRATVLDSSFDDYVPGARSHQLAANELLGDARALEFEDGSFTVAVAVDLLEHIAPADRDVVVSELCRVSSDLTVIACPAGAQALAADRRLSEWFGHQGREAPGWLVEHLTNGFPESTAIAATAARYGQVRTFGNEALSAHTRMITAESKILTGLLLRLGCRPLESMLRSQRPRARALASRVLAEARGGDRDPVYRTVVMIDRVTGLPGPGG